MRKTKEEELDEVKRSRRRNRIKEEAGKSITGNSTDKSVNTLQNTIDRYTQLINELTEKNRQKHIEIEQIRQST